MSRRERRVFTQEFKTEVAIEALKGDHKISEIAEMYDVMPPQVSLWKKMAKDAMMETFKASKRGRKPNREKLVKSLQKRIYALEIELAKYRSGGSIDEALLLNTLQRSLSFSDDESSLSSDFHLSSSSSHFKVLQHGDDELSRAHSDGFNTLALEEAMETQKATILNLETQLQRIQSVQASDRRTLEALLKRCAALERGQETTKAPTDPVPSQPPLQSYDPPTGTSSTNNEPTRREKELGLSVRISAIDANTPRCPECSESFKTNAAANTTITCPLCNAKMRWFQNRKEQWYTKTISSG